MMSLTEDRLFEDQIEKMKKKNQMILDRFNASEEDRKRAESSGSTINKGQSVQIRLKNEDQIVKRKKSTNNPPARPKSYHDGSHNDSSSLHYAYNQFNESRKQGKFSKNGKPIDDDVAYQDYFHFQQTHASKVEHGGYKNRPSYQYQSSAPSYTDDNHGYKTPNYRDYQRSTSQKLKTSPRYNSNNNQNNHHHQNNYQTTKITTKHNDQSVFKLDNTKINEPNNPRATHFNTRNQSKFKLNNNNSGNNQNIDPAESSSKQIDNKTPSPITKTSTVLDDEYIDDTLEDLEQYRLKVDMEDFTVIDPEMPNPILAMPLTPWTNDTTLLPQNNNNEEDDKHNESSATDLLNDVNGRAKDYLNLVDKSNIDNLSSLDLKKCEEGDSIPN